jgi:hypothetical protein
MTVRALCCGGIVLLLAGVSGVAQSSESTTMTAEAP